jgi:shikimate dehydrogenase
MGKSVMDDQPDIVVNCTPVGGWNSPESSPFAIGFNWPQGKIYSDLNYNTDNQLVAAARSAGMIAIDGSMMLVGQAIRSFNIWTGEDVDFDNVYRRVFG